MRIMRPTAVLLSASIIASGFPVSQAFADTEKCEIDEIMLDTRKIMDDMAIGVFEAQVTEPMEEQIDSAPHVRDGACLPILDTFDTMIRMQIPSIGAIAGAILTQIRNMVCGMANDFLAGLASRAQVNVSDPLGVASVGVGVTTDGTGGIETETYDISEVIKEGVTDAVKSKIMDVRSDSNRVIRNLPRSTQDRQPNLQENIKDGVGDAIRGL